MDVSIIIPVLNKLEFTNQCLDRIWRNSGDDLAYELIVVDNASSDGTRERFAAAHQFPRPLRYIRNEENVGFARANNQGAQLSGARYLLFLNNDTLVQTGWLREMVRVARAWPRAGIVGLKQLFPYTNLIYHTGIVFTPDGRPEHLYPHLDASLPRVNQEREYQAVTGACLLVDRELFLSCNGFDEGYLNGYEDVDLCLEVRRRGRAVVCCTTAWIYHYGQISEGRTADDDRNAARFAAKWAGAIRPDREEYLARDARLSTSVQRSGGAPFHLADDCVYLTDELEQASALTWFNAELALALHDRGVPVLVNCARPSPTLPASARKRLESLAALSGSVGGVQLKWSHYWPRHLNLELTGDLNLEFFVINYLFGSVAAEPWDYWLQCVRQNDNQKLPLSGFCRSVLAQLGVPDDRSHVVHPGYAREVLEVEAPSRRDATFRFLTVTNSHDLLRYGTDALLDAYRRAFGADDDVVLVLKDYGSTSRDTTLRDQAHASAGGPRLEYRGEFTDKHELIRLYKSSDAYVSAHRGEGFGMKILDAMACGLPVVTPLFGGPTAYCSQDNCFPVAFSLVPMGDCLDTRSLKITNQPRWAEPDVHSLAAQMRRVYEERTVATRVGEHARASVLERFSWDQTAACLMDVVGRLRDQRANEAARKPAPPVTQPPVERSPYWLGVRVSVIVPTRNRHQQLLACLDRLARQSILPQEFEVLVIDDGSTDGTADSIEGRRFPFALRYYRQDGAGPGAARNVGIEQAAGEIVLFIGDDILAHERLLEEHLLAHAAGHPGLAVLGHIDWPAGASQNAVMEYVCGDAGLQFGYTLIPKLSKLDHRFFYTSNISVRREFLVSAARAGIAFDRRFRRAAFEDAEFAFRLMPRGLEITYRPEARAEHDHAMDLDQFAAREFGAGEMAVVFYRKHPVNDGELQVQWMSELSGPAESLRSEPDFLKHLEAFDRQTDALLRGFVGSLEELLAMGSQAPAAVPEAELRQALHGVLHAIFDVERTRGKVQEWFANVEGADLKRIAQAVASVRRKIEFLSSHGRQVSLPGALDPKVVASLKGRIEDRSGNVRVPTSPMDGRRSIARLLRPLLADPRILPRVLAADRYIQHRLAASGHRRWLLSYTRIRGRFRSLM